MMIDHCEMECQGDIFLKKRGELKQPVLHDEGGNAEKIGFGSCVFSYCWMYNLIIGGRPLRQYG